MQVLDSCKKWCAVSKVLDKTTQTVNAFFQSNISANDLWKDFFKQQSTWCITDWVVVGTQTLSHTLRLRVFLEIMVLV